MNESRLIHVAFRLENGRLSEGFLDGVDSLSPWRSQQLESRSFLARKVSIDGNAVARESPGIFERP